MAGCANPLWSGRVDEGGKDVRMVQVCCSKRSDDGPITVHVGLLYRRQLTGQLGSMD